MLFLREDSPNLGDHDCPNPGYLIISPGYQQLVPKLLEENIAEDYTAHEFNDYSKENFNYDEDMTEKKDVD